MCCRKLVSILFILLVFSSATYAQGELLIPSINARGAAGPAWGPYSNRYAGISHVADSVSGLRFDFSVFLGQYRGKIVVPNARFESDWYPWQATPDLNYYSYREELEWKDKVFADIAFAPLDAHTRLMKITLTNNLNTLQSLALHFMAGVVYPNGLATQVTLPAKRKWNSAIDYTQLNFTRSRIDDNLIADGLLKGEVQNNEFVNGSGLASGFGEAGDQVKYVVNIADDCKNGVLLFRYKLPEGKKAFFKVAGLINDQIELDGAASTFTIKTGTLKKGSYPLELVAVNNVPIALDGFCVVEENELPEVQFKQPVKQPVPVMEQPFKKTLLLKYPDAPQYYGLIWRDETEYKIREILTDELDNAIRTVAGDNIYPHHYTRKDAHTANVFLRAIQMAGNTQKIIYALLTDGSRNEVRQSLQSFPPDEKLEAVFKKYAGNNVAAANDAGKKYAFANKMLQTTVLQNIVYPIYTQRQFTKQFVPGKRWSSLYTWDNGFTGIGMANVDIKRAIESLQVYTTDSASTNAYTHHGSLVPIQFFLYKEIWDKTQSKELLAYFYPRMKKYYRFFCGEYGSSSTKKLSSGLLNTFDYFYNSGGWDDYPAQEHMHAQKLSAVTAPVISSSIAIRIAKIMSQAASILSINDDTSYYRKHIDSFTDSLQKYSWDEASGYFGYVLHDKVSGKPSGILRTEKGVNYNMGIDGIYPLIAGICTPPQRDAALKHLFSNKACWTDIGISAVDQSAPYFSLQGYWNGAVWFPHQWIIWKTMFDLGEANKAFQIAKTALDLYKKDVDSTYFTSEIFRIDTKKGNGWKQFGALSSPVLSWYNAYFKPGTITTGFDAWVINKTVTSNKQKLTATVQLAALAHKKPALLICMPQGKKYYVTINGKAAMYTEPLPGTLQIQPDANVKDNFIINVVPVHTSI